MVVSGPPCSSHIVASRHGQAVTALNLGGGLAWHALGWFAWGLIFVVSAQQKGVYFGGCSR